MSRGKKIITFRISDLLDQEIEKAIENRNTWSREEPWTRTNFFLIAAKEKLAHMKRSRSKNRVKKTAKPKQEGINQ